MFKINFITYFISFDISVLPCSYSYNSKETSPFIHTIEDHLKEETVSDTEIDEYGSFPKAIVVRT